MRTAQQELEESNPSSLENSRTGFKISSLDQTIPKWLLSDLLFSALIVEIYFVNRLEMRLPISIAKSAGPGTEVDTDNVFMILPQSYLFLDTAAKSIVSKSKPSAFPSALRSKQSAVQTLTSEDADTDAVIQMTCPRCQRTEMRYYTAQLRSADEGTTVFYSCVCGYK